MKHVDQLAKVLHDANRALCQSFGDDSQKPWENAPEWQRKATYDGIDSTLTPEESHQQWATSKLADGWKYGPVKDADAKTHPLLVPYSELPFHDRLKDYLRVAIIDAFRKCEAAEGA
jgi:hypothetical protein